MIESSSRSCRHELSLDAGSANLLGTALVETRSLQLVLTSCTADRFLSATLAQWQER